MIKVLTENERKAIIEYCNGNENHWECSEEPLECLDNTIKQYLSIKEDTVYVDKDILDKICTNIQTLADYFYIETTDQIYNSDFVECFAMEQLKKSMEENILDWYVIKKLVQCDTLGNNFYNHWYVDSIWAPYFEVLTYNTLGMVLEDLVDKIKEKVGI